MAPTGIDLNPGLTFIDNKTLLFIRENLNATDEDKNNLLSENSVSYLVDVTDSLVNGSIFFLSNF